MPVLPKPDYCKPCPLYNASEYGTGMGFSSLEGYGDSGLLVVADSLGAREEEDGLPLRPWGRSGAVFRRALDELGIDSQGLTITNVVRCRPPGNELWGQPWTFDAVDHCRHYLSGAIGQRQPTILLALGDAPLQELAAEAIGSVSTVRGFVLRSKYGMPLISTYHPSFIARGAWNLYGAFKQDVGRAHLFARQGVPAMLETDYVLHPSLDDVRAFLADVLAHPEWPISYDVETAHMLGEKEPEDWRLKRLIQIQFSVQPGQAIVLPWDNGPYSELSKQILATPNPKWGWNSRLSDDIILVANGCVINGERHDLMLAWAHLQPDFTSRGDDREGDEKGIPSKLMGLQSAASFYCPEVGPWKHLAHSNLQLYGAFDADYTTRCGQGIFRELNRLGLMPGYLEHKYNLRWVLDDLGDHGLPVDRERQSALRVYTLGELSRIQGEIHAQVPSEILSVHPKAGYKALHSKVSLVDPTQQPDQWPKASLRELSAEYDASQPPLVMAAGHIGYLRQREFEDNGNRRTTRKTDNGEQQLSNQVALPIENVELGGALARPAVLGQDAIGGAEGSNGRAVRWCIERLYNPHASSPNTKSYIRYRGYRMPTHIVTGQDTTGKTELLKLAKETGDAVLKLTYDWRDLAKTGLDYTTGKWVPGEDGRVHPTFKTGATASQQTVCVDPNAQQFPEHTGLAKRAKEAIKAEPGHLFVKVDMRGFHSRMVGWLANDPLYYQLADEDVHSFFAAHYLNLPDALYLMDMSTDERRAYLEIVKEEHKPTRNYKVKRVVHGRQFGMRIKKLYQLHGADFDPPVDQVIADVGEARWYDWNPKRQLEEINARGWAEAKKLFEVFDHTCPKTFVLYPTWVREQIHHKTPNRIVSPFGHHRFFWNWDMEQANAFLPSNCAHCHIQSALIRMRASGALRAFGFCNFTHDAGWFHCPEPLVGDCVATVQHEFELPSTILVDSPLGPFQCNSDAEVGPDLAHMSTYEP